MNDVEIAHGQRMHDARGTAKRTETDPVDRITRSGYEAAPP